MTVFVQLALMSGAGAYPKLGAISFHHAPPPRPAKKRMPSKAGHACQITQVSRSGSQWSGFSTMERPLGPCTHDPEQGSRRFLIGLIEHWAKKGHRAPYTGHAHIPLHLETSGLHHRPAGNSGNSASNLGTLGHLHECGSPAFGIKAYGSNPKGDPLSPLGAAYTCRAHASPPSSARMLDLMRNTRA